jgi:hypothetical protein
MPVSGEEKETAPYMFLFRAEKDDIGPTANFGT